MVSSISHRSPRLSLDEDFEWIDQICKCLIPSHKGFQIEAFSCWRLWVDLINLFNSYKSLWFPRYLEVQLLNIFLRCVKTGIRPFNQGEVRRRTKQSLGCFSKKFWLRSWEERGNIRVEQILQRCSFDFPRNFGGREKVQKAFLSDRD